MKINGGGSIKPVSPTGVQDVAKSGPLGPTAPASTRGEKVEVGQEATSCADWKAFWPTSG